MKEISYYEYDKSNLVEWEVEVLDILMEVGKVTQDIWAKQYDDNREECGFYPEGVTEEEVLKAANLDDKIASPYTIVKKSGNRLFPVDYCDEYKEEIAKVIELLEDAASKCKDGGLKKYINRVKKNLDKCAWEELLVTYLTNKNTKIEFMFGPIETYEDKLCGKKKAFQFNLRILKDDATEEIDQMIDVIKKLQILRPEDSFASGISGNQLRVRVDDVLMLSGRQSGLLLSSSNHPDEEKLAAKHGVKITVFTTTMYEKFNQKLLPILAHIDGVKKSEYDEIREATFRLIALHEITEGVVLFPDMSERLGKHYDYIRELNADILGVHSAKYHVLNGIITSEQYKHLIIAFLAYAIDTCNRVKEGEAGSAMEYAKGFSIAFNYFFETEALKFKDNKISVDFIKISRDIEVLASLILQVLEDGVEMDAEALLAQYGGISICEKLPKIK